MISIVVVTVGRVLSNVKQLCITVISITDSEEYEITDSEEYESFSGDAAIDFLIFLPPSFLFCSVFRSKYSRLFLLRC